MSMRSIAVLPALLLGALLVVLAGCSSTKPIVVGSDLDNAPFAYLDKDGNAAGRDVDMMIAIAHMLEPLPRCSTTVLPRAARSSCCGSIWHMYS